MRPTPFGHSNSMTEKRTTPKRTSSKRELIEPRPGDRRYVRRNPDGTFKESVDASRSLSQDARVHAKTAAKPGQGDRGDRNPG